MMNIIIKYRATAFIMLLSFVVTACGESAEPVNSSGSSITTASESAATLKLSSASQEAVVGTTFTLNVELSEFPVTEGGGVNIGYSPEVLQVNKVSINSDVWGFVNQQGTIDNSAGLVSNVLVSSYQDVKGEAVVATVTFEAIAAGNSDITLSESTINPFASAGTTVNPQFVSSHVIVR